MSISDKIKNILSTYGQQHLMDYFEKISDQEKENLISQIKKIDFSVLDVLKQEKNCICKRDGFSPIEAVTIDEIAIRKNEFENKGLEAIKSSKLAAVLLAGGQGTRLGSDKPKGMYNIGVTNELYIFECLINNLMEVVNKSGVWIPLYIMTSEKNHEDTVKFFKEKNNFGYNSDYINFFIQDMAPSTDYNGKIYMENTSQISISPNGNGGWFSSMKRAGIVEELKTKGVEWLNVFAVDNVLQRIADPAFLGAVLISGCETGSKVVSKTEPNEKVGVMCLENGKPSIIEYYEMNDEMLNMRNSDGNLSYRFGVILNYLFNINKLEQIVNNNMPIHVVEKKIPYMSENGDYVKPETPNGYKFEKLILDMISMHDSCLVYEVIRNKEFAPVKNAVGVDSVESARQLLKENGVDL